MNTPSLDNPLPCPNCGCCAFWQNRAGDIYCGECKSPRKFMFSVTRWLWFCGDPETDMRWWETCEPYWGIKHVA